MLMLTVMLAVMVAGGVVAGCRIVVVRLGEGLEEYEA